MKFTWNLTSMGGAALLLYGIVARKRWAIYTGGAVFGFYAVVYPNLIAPQQQAAK